MTEAINNEAAPASPATSTTIWLVGDQTPTATRLQAAITALDGGHDVISVTEPARLLAAALPVPPVLCCLMQSEYTDDTQRTVALIRKLTGTAPILLVGHGAASESSASALARANGAWDHAPIDNEALLSLRLQQALEVGRQRQELAHAAIRLNTLQRRLDVLLSEGSDARARIVDRHITHANAAFARLLGAHDTEAVRGSDLSIWVRDADLDAFSKALEQSGREHTDSNLVFQLEPDGARTRTVRALLRPEPDEQSQGTAVDIVLQDVDSAPPLLPEHAQRPPLDARMALHGVLANATLRTREHVLGLAFIAIDDITALQTRFGLARSDLLLQEVGLFLLQMLYGEDRCFRFGAGEYVLLIERQSREEITAAVQRIHAALGKELFGDEQCSANLSSSMTHTLLTGEASENDRGLRRVMDAAYDLREHGGDACRNCAETTTESGDPATLDEWSNRLQDALAHDRFSLAYQSITSLAGDNQPFFDVLLRYIDDRGTLVRPGEFLSVAEQIGLMPDIDRWVTRHAIEVIGQQLAKDAEVALFIKLSVPTLLAGDEFMRWLEDAMAAHANVPRHSLIFSLREEDARTQPQAAQAIASQLDAQGFRVALTHFGGTSKSARMLDGLPIAFLKLSPSFAKHVANSGLDERLVQIISSSREHRIPLIAEQIEDANSMARLWQAGVNYVQGHFIQEPDTGALTHDGHRML